jgi:UDP-2,3-diacylglucosamine pyrophosphatase LpxH
MNIFAISDLHIGDGGPRDNFEYLEKEKKLYDFLDFVQDNNGSVIICGDLFELWQSNISKVLTKRVKLLDRLSSMGATYILGNHDSDLMHFIGGGWLRHKFFRMMCTQCNVYSKSGKLYIFTHGHQVDTYCASETPGLGRIAAIYAGIKEDRNGSPIINKYSTIEQDASARLGRIVRAFNFLRRKPDRNELMNKGLFEYKGECDVIVSGHTHVAGRIRDWHYNCGTWAEEVDSFVYVDDSGISGVYDWVNGNPVSNNNELKICK